MKGKKINNPVRKHLFEFNKPKVERDKSKYSRKGVQKKRLHE